MKNIYIGIDYSINSPAICVLKNNTYEWVTYGVINKTKKDKLLQTDLSKLPDINLKIQENKLELEDYEDSDLLKMVKYELQSDVLFKMLLYTLGPNVNKVLIGIEGYSYGSRFTKTDSIIELATATTLFKRNILKQLYTENDVYKIYAPGTIKKTAGKGNYKKRELFDVFIENRLEDEILTKSHFYNYCKTLKVGKKVPSPIDDMIDAYFVLKTLQLKETGKLA